MTSITTKLANCSVGIAFLALGGTTSPASANDRGPYLEQCQVEGISGHVDCGSIEVPENWQDPDGRNISLNIVVSRATEVGAKLADPLVFVAGGPGIDVTSSAAWRSQSWAKIRTTRDLVFIDARGTGGKKALKCDYPGPPEAYATIIGKIWSADRFRHCLHHLGANHDLSQYTTINIATDLAYAVKLLGYRNANFVGSSYGSRVVMELMSHRPDLVRTGITVGMAIPRKNGINDLGKQFKDALEARVRQCNQTPACNQVYPTFYDDFTKIVRRLDEGPIEVELENQALGGTEKISLSKGSFLHIVRNLLYDARRSAHIPKLIQEVAMGRNNGLLADFAQRFEPGQAKMLADAMWATIQCSEDFKGTDLDHVQKSSVTNFYGLDRVTNIAKLCGFWPQAPHPEAHSEYAASAHPLLIFNGSADPATPLSWATDLASQRSNTFVTVVPGGSHGLGFVWDNCLVPYADTFLTTQDDSGLRDAKALFIT